MNDALFDEVHQGDPLFDEPRQTPTRARAPRLPRTDSLFAPVKLVWLRNRAWDQVFPSKVRLYLYLLIRSHRGLRSVRFTNTMAAEIGLDRHQKSRHLAALQRLGLVITEQAGRGTVLVSVQQRV
jgi:hypothetical protein